MSLLNPKEDEGLKLPVFCDVLLFQGGRTDSSWYFENN
jgi:hypothetical protein